LVIPAHLLAKGAATGTAGLTISSFASPRNNLPDVRVDGTGAVCIVSPERSTMSDQDIQKLESQFPAVSGSAFAAARKKVLESGQSVLQSEGGIIYEVFPDGRKIEVKQIEQPTPVVAGSIYTIR
jgi:hypothetical protein